MAALLSWGREGAESAKCVLAGRHDYTPPPPTEYSRCLGTAVDFLA